MIACAADDDFKPKKKRAYANEASEGGVHAQIQQDISENKVVVFMKGVPDAPMCGFSNAVVQVMKAEKVEFTAFNVLADPELREGIKSFSSWPTIPQIYVNGEFIGGCDVTIEMYKSGVRPLRAAASRHVRACSRPDAPAPRGRSSRRCSRRPVRSRTERLSWSSAPRWRRSPRLAQAQHTAAGSEEIFL